MLRGVTGCVVAFLAVATVSGIAAETQTDSPPLLIGKDLPAGVVAPKLIETPKGAWYPAIAIRCNLTGTAELELLVTAQGAVASVKLVSSSGYTALDAASINRATQFRYAPATKDGVAIPVRVGFKLKYGIEGMPSPKCNLPASEFTNGATLAGGSN